MFFLGWSFIDSAVCCALSVLLMKLLEGVIGEGCLVWEIEKVRRIEKEELTSQKPTNGVHTRENSERRTHRVINLTPITHMHCGVQ